MTELEKAARMAVNAWLDLHGMPELCKEMQALRRALEQEAQQESEAVRAAWMAGYTEGERQALEQPAQQEPKFVRNVDGVPCITLAEHKHLMRSRPQAREPLSDEQIAEIAASPAAIPGRYVYSFAFAFARAIEAAHGITGSKP